MNLPTTYIPSQTLSGDTERIRQHSFTRWMSNDLLQAATDFCKNLGLISIYSECSADHLTRYLFWRPPQGARFEIRSGRTEDHFREFDQANMAKSWPLLSLHINKNDRYSAVWISREQLRDYHSHSRFLWHHARTTKNRNVIKQCEKCRQALLSIRLFALNTRAANLSLDEAPKAATNRLLAT